MISSNNRHLLSVCEEWEGDQRIKTKDRGRGFPDIIYNVMNIQYNNNSVWGHLGVSCNTCEALTYTYLYYI